MSLQAIERHMEMLKLLHTRSCVGELLEEASRDKRGPLEFLDKLLAMEVEAREERRIATSLKISGLPRGMRLESFDYLFQPAVEKSRVEFLGSSEYIRRAENVLLFGPPDPDT